MIVAALLGAVLASQPAPLVIDPRADFVALCVETRGEPDSVRRALLTQTGWEPAAGPDDLTIWRRTSGEHAETLTIGRREVGGGPKDICSIQLSPGDEAVIAGAPEGLAPVTGAINAEAGLYFVAASDAAVTARDFDFVSVTHDAELTTLLLLRPVR